MDTAARTQLLDARSLGQTINGAVLYYELSFEAEDGYEVGGLLLESTQDFLIIDEYNFRQTTGGIVIECQVISRDRRFGWSGAHEGAEQLPLRLTTTQYLIPSKPS